jgi:uncharacterized protein (DUF1015 family)
MGEIKPFKGITYNKEKNKDLDDLMSPPYDIISKKLQEELYDKSTYNFVRLILGKQYDSDTEKDNRYTRAKKDYDKWLTDEILIQSEEPAIYPYQITYELNGKTKKMNGFFTLLKLDKDYKLVKAHERTLSKPKADRLKLMRACKSNLEPIQLLYIDEQDEILQSINKIKGVPLISVTGYDSFNHQIWKISDKQMIETVKNRLENEILFIADGHHRYQTAINFAEEQAKQSNVSDNDAPYNYRMVILVNMFDDGLAILPTHRLIKMSSIDRKNLIRHIRKYFIVEEFDLKTDDKTKLIVKEISNKLKTKNEHKFALFFKDGYYLLTLKDKDIMNTLANDHSETWRTLDVSILHKIILEHIMGITQDTLEDHIKYTRDDEEAVSFVQDDTFDCSVLMNATKINELKIIADGGEHMPQKSTYFLPKMLSGLVVYKME